MGGGGGGGVGERERDKRERAIVGEVDGTGVSRKQKLLLYRAGVALVLLGLVWPCQQTQVGCTFLAKSDGGLALPSLSLMYKKLKVSQAMLLLNKATEEVSKRLIHKEEANKQARFQPMLQSREVMAAAPGAQRSVLSRRVKMLVSQEDETARKPALAYLPEQGEMLMDSSLLADIVCGLMQYQAWGPRR